MPHHPFDDAIRLEAVDAQTWAGQTSDAYWNAISPFGGVTAATILQAALAHPERQGDPLSLTVNFVSAIAKGDFRITSRIVATSRSTQHWAFELRQPGSAAPGITATAVFAVPRDTWRDTEAAMPALPPFDALARQTPHTPIAFLERYDLRYAGSPFGDGSTSRTSCWIADQPPRPVDFVSLVAYCDVFFPRLFIRQRAASPISTVTLSVNFHACAAELQAANATHALGTAHANVFGNGFYDQVGSIWSPDGKLLATTQQLVWYKVQ